MASCLIGSRGLALVGVSDPAPGWRLLGKCATSVSCASTVHYEIWVPVLRPELLHALCEVLLRWGSTTGMFINSEG